MNETRVRGLYASVIKVARNDGGDDNVIVAQLGSCVGIPGGCGLLYAMIINQENFVN